MRTLAASIPQPSFVWLWLLFESAGALIQGDLQASEQWAIQAFEVAAAAGEPDAALFLGGQMFTVRQQQGRSGELVEQMVQSAGDPRSLPASRAAAATALIDAGREAEARELALAEDFQSLPWDQVWSGAVLWWAEVCSRLDLGGRAQELYELLAPFSGQLAAGAA